MTEIRNGLSSDNLIATAANRFGFVTQDWFYETITKLNYIEDLCLQRKNNDVSNEAESISPDALL